MSKLITYEVPKILEDQQMKRMAYLLIGRNKQSNRVYFIKMQIITQL